MSSAAPEEPRNGRIVTFYSFKGGTGRTMALANVAWILASNGHRVLVADWDLESPGLHRFFAPFLDQAVREAAGIIDMVRDYEWVAESVAAEVRQEAPLHKWTAEQARAEMEERLQPRIAEHARLQKYAISLRHWKFPDGGTLDFLSPGRQNRDYLATLSALDWDNFYKTLNGGEFLNAIREDMKRHYDYVLIDSRTGLSDIADICTVHLPDVLVDCFTLSTQGVNGAADVARRVGAQYGYRSIRVLPVLMRVDPSEQDKVETSRSYAYRHFENLPAGMTEAQRRAYWANVEVPYRAYYAFEETLAVFADTPGVPGSMLSSYERITGYITDGKVTGLPPVDDELRNSTRVKFDRKPPMEDKQVIIEFLAEDQIWAEWITAVLSAGGFFVRDQRLEEQPSEGSEHQDGRRTLTVVSAAYIAWRRSRRRGDPQEESADMAQHGAHGRPSLAAYVTPIAATRALPEFAAASSIRLADARSEADAIDRLERTFHIPPDPEERSISLPRYPGAEPRIRGGVGARNDRFTGRETDLQELREQLRNSSTAVVRPITLHGTAGVGKTAIALEYVHRFKNDYDLIWWIDCERFAEIDLQVADLAEEMHLKFGTTVPPDAIVADKARLVLDVLGNGETVRRWLLIYDNAENINAVRDYLPLSGGQVLITSQNKGWEDQGARLLPVEEFDRQDSIAYLLRVVPSLAQEAAQPGVPQEQTAAYAIAEAFGDLPVAITAVAAFLRDAGYPIADYLRELEREPPSALTVGALADYPRGVAAAWDAPLSLLRERSPASARLLELCSVMAPNIGVALVYSQAMAEVLESYDPALAEPLIMGRVVQEAARLNLLKHDSTTKQIQVHRVPQTVIRSKMSADQIAAARDDMQRVLLAARPRRDVSHPATWDRYRLLWPHLGPVEVVSSANDRVRQLVIDRVRYIYVFSDYERGLAEGTAAVAHWEEMLAAGPAPAMERALRTQLLQLQFNLANILRSLSRFQDAWELNESVLAGQIALLGEEHPHTLMTAGSLAGDLRALGRYHEALERDEKTYPAWIGQYGEDNERTLQAANNLAVSYRLTGDVSAARRLDQATHDRAVATLGRAHPFTLLAERNFARDLLEAGEYSEALESTERIYRACLEDKELGPDSVAALDALVLFSIALRTAGRSQDAEPLFEEAYRHLFVRFGNDLNSMSLACRLSRSANLLSLERFSEAEEGIRAVLAEYERTLGPHHPYWLVCQVNLAATLRLRLMHDQAVEAITLALDGLTQVLGASHPYTLAAAMMNGVLLADEGDLGRAEELETRTASALAQALGADHPDTLRCRANLLLTRQQRGEHTAAERERVIGQLEALLGPGHPTVATLRGERRVLRALDPQPF